MPIYKMEGRRDGKQKYRVRINYINDFGKPKQIDRVTYGTAEAKWLEKKLMDEIHEQPSNRFITVQQLCEEYESIKRHEVRETTLDKTHQILKRHVLPALGNVKINKLNKSVLQQWKTDISKKTFSTKTKQNIYGEFRALLNYAVKMEYIPRNPLTLVGNFRDVYFESKRDKIHYYTPEQFKKYITTAKKDCTKLSDWCFYVFFNIAYYTGMRKGEINALKWSDIDGDIIHVRRSIAQKIKGSDIETPPKNKTSYRDLQAPLPLLQILNEHKQRQMTLEGFSEDFRVCGGARCLRDTSIDKYNRKCAELSCLPHIRIHDFRHSHASLLANNGINIQEIARRLGHSKIEITWNTYSHLYPRENERAMEILNKIV